MCLLKIYLFIFLLKEDVVLYFLFYPFWYLGILPLAGQIMPQELTKNVSDDTEGHGLTDLGHSNRSAP